MSHGFKSDCNFSLETLFVLLCCLIFLVSCVNVMCTTTGGYNRGVGKGGAGGAVAPPLFEKGGHSPPTFWAVICINCLYLLSSAVKR